MDPISRKKSGVSAEPPKIVKPPGFLWIVILGAVGFCAGFFGPLIFVPEANQGPLVGILMTGPGGGLLGLILFLVMKITPVPARAQWVLLTGLSVMGTLVIFYYVQPEPETRGYILEFEVSGTRRPAEATDAVIAGWKKRTAEVTWASPRTGWEPQMRAELAKDQGRVLDGVLLRQRKVKMHRKPWNRGQLFVTDWQPKNEKHSYYVRPEDQVVAATGSQAQLFIDYNFAFGIRAPDIWPPMELDAFISLSRVTAVPPEYEQLP